MKFRTFIIDTLTNMHVGSGEASFSIVDNHIQRDCVTSVPMINSSGVKGALRDQIDLGDSNVIVYGKEPKEKGRNEKETDKKVNETDKDDDDKSMPGQFIFMDAKLIAVPLRSSANVFYYATSPKVIIEFLYAQEMMGVLTPNNSKELRESLAALEFSADEPFKLLQYPNNINELEIEDFFCMINNNRTAELPGLSDLILGPLGISKADIAIFRNDSFKQVCESYMPVIARNCIDDKKGTSKNLFYEEVLPRSSKLAFTVGYDHEKYETLMNTFTTNLKAQMIQFGANYSIGYGFSKIHSYKGGK